MNQKIIFLLSITIVLFSIPLLATNNPVLVTTIQNNKSVEMSMNLDIDGSLKLYSVFKENVEKKSKHRTTFINWGLNPDKDFYIGLDGKVELITPINFKRLVKKYFSATPELVERIGKRGFRYNNLLLMILYYNKKIANKGGLTKSDIMLAIN